VIGTLGTTSIFFLIPANPDPCVHRWQRLRAAEVEFEIHQKELGLKKLADTERDIRRRIEDIMDPHLTTTQVQVNGKENKVKVNGTGKAGKKRKTAG